MGDAPALFPELPPGRYEVTVGGEVVEVELPAGELTELDIELSTATVAGRLLDADGSGVVARLELDDPAPKREGWPQSAGNDTESGADGSFTFHIVWPGKCRLRVYVDRGGTESLVFDDVLTVPCRGRHEPVIRLERPV